MLEFLKSLGIKNIKPLSGFHNEIYEGEYQSNELVIRVSSRRTTQEIEEEVKVLNRIKSSVRVGEPIKVENNYNIVFDNFQIVFFQKVQGKSWRDTLLTNEIHYNAGKELGLLHLNLGEISLNYRKDFRQHPDIYLLEKLPSVYKNELHRVIDRLDIENSASLEYGLIHGDYLYSNLIFNDDIVTIIDFDDLENGFYLYDIAVYLFYLLLGGDPENIDKTTNIEVFKHFIKGYLSVNSKTVLDFAKIQDLFRLRQLKLFATISTQMDPLKYGVWQKKFINLLDYQMKANKNFIDIDYNQLIKEVIFDNN